MNKIAVFLPSKGRPKAFKEALESFQDCSTGYCDVLGLLDDDDPTLPEYRKLKLDRGLVLVSEGMKVVPKINWAYNLFRHYKVMMLVGDDCRCLTQGWDKRFMDELDAMGGKGMVFGDDGRRHEEYADHFAITTNLIDCVGYFGHPKLLHYYYDMIWNTMCKELDILKYLDDVKIHHNHYITTINERDNIYAENELTLVSGKHQYIEWVKAESQGDIHKIKKLLEEI